MLARRRQVFKGMSATAALRLYDDLLPRRWCLWLQKQLKRVRRAANNARDCDVLIERLVARFGSLPEILSASAAELESVEGIGAATARHVRDGLARLVEASIFERYE